MVLTKEQISQMEEAAKPLVKWLCENTDPHAKVIVDCGSAEVVSGSARVKIEEFIKD